MEFLLIVFALVLIAIVLIQIGRVADLSRKLKGERLAQIDTNNSQGWLTLIFGIVFLVGTVVSAIMYGDYMLGFGTNQAASIHGVEVDRVFKVTLFFTGIVFLVTHVALFWFAYKYRGQLHSKASYFHHDTKLEIIWTAIPAVVMAFLVIDGLDVWNKATANVKAGEDFIELEAIGYQFAWDIRYPGPDKALGSRNYRLTTANNSFGQDYTDPKNWDDIRPDKIVLPKGKKVKVSILARDVLHSFYLPHFRVKMDAVPGIPTYFVFTPTMTTKDYREKLSKNPKYQMPADPTEPNGLLKWEAFNYELACAELCGKGHFSMRKLVEVVEEDEYEAWLATQSSYYMNNIRNSDEDPNIDKLLTIDVQERKKSFDASLSEALAMEDANDRIIRMDYVNFETGSAELTENSKYELSNLIEAMEAHAAMTIEVSGHTDNVGQASANQTLSQERANVVKDYLVDHGVAASRMQAKGYGQNKPVDTNDTPEGQAQNRRTEFKILTI